MNNCWVLLKPIINRMPGHIKDQDRKTTGRTIRQNSSNRTVTQEDIDPEASRKFTSPTITAIQQTRLAKEGEEEAISLKPEEADLSNSLRRRGMVTLRSLKSKLCRW